LGVLVEGSCAGGYHDEHDDEVPKHAYPAPAVRMVLE